MELTVGPIQYFWKADQWSEFYRDLAQAPVDRVILGELVCSKRLPYFQDRIEDAITTLFEAGKKVSLTSLALITLKRERKLMADLVEMGIEIEVNDLTALAYIPQGIDFIIGPLINVYNEGTLSWLASRGARRVCLPPELPLDSVQVLSDTAKTLGVTIETWGHGRLPLAISGRCYHARLHGRTKDNCQFACEDDPDGLDVKTLDHKPFLTMNGVQTLSDTYACTAHQIETLKQAGVSALRLSPQSTGFADLCRQYRQRVEGQITADMLVASLQSADPDIRLSDGFLTGATGVEFSGTR